jgi:hypothetical protein
MLDIDRRLAPPLYFRVPEVTSLHDFIIPWQGWRARALPTPLNAIYEKIKQPWLLFAVSSAA